MKKHVLAFGLVLFLYMQAKGQFIIAGQHGAKDYYAVPDTTVPGNNCGEDGNSMGDSSSYLIDMNGDGIMDFEFTNFCNDQLSFQVSWTEIYSLNNNEIVFGYYDDSICCDGPIPHEFRDSDTINNNRIWTKSSLNISYSQLIDGGGRCYDNVIADTVDNIIYDTGSAYLGVRVFLAQDTLYGWIKITGEYYGGTTILSYACNLGVTGINEYQNNYSIKLYPNPATNQLTIQTSSLHSNEGVMVLIMNVLGQETSPPTPLPLERGVATIDVSGLPAGVYFVEVTTAENRWIGKFVKE